MRFYIGLFFCLGCFFVGCSESSDDPKGLTMPEMADVLADIHIVNGSLYQVANQPDSIAKHGLGLYLEVFKLHHTDSATFRSSLHYYTMHPDVLYVIYEGVGRRLTKKVDSLKKVKDHIEAVKRKQPNFKRDSIREKTKVDSIAKIRAQHVGDSIKAVNKRLDDEANRLKLFHKKIEFKHVAI